MTADMTDFSYEGTCLCCGKRSLSLSVHDVCADCTEHGPPARPWNTPPEDLREDDVPGGHPPA